MTQLAFSPDGSVLAAAQDFAVKIWQVGDWAPLEPFQTGTITDTAFSLDGALLATGASFSLSVELWEVSSGELLGTLLAPGDTTQVVFSPDGETLVSAHIGGTITIWRFSDETLLHTIDAHNGIITSLAVSPDGELVASASLFPDPTVKVWCTADGSLVRTLESQNFRGGNVFFSPDGEYLAATSDTTLGTNLWRVSDWSLEDIMPIWGSAFTPDSMAVVEIVGSGVVFWQVGERKMVKGWQTAGVTVVTFSPDGSLVAFGTTKGEIQVWKYGVVE